MTERVPCCIRGCRRSFKFSALGDGHDELLCRKHFRVDKELVQQLNRVRKLIRRVNGIGRRWQRKQGGALTHAQIARLDRTWDVLRRRDELLWATIKAKAQELQDAGYWAPRPRRKRVLKNEPIPDGQEKRHADRFEDQFQRLKKTMR